MTEGDGKSSIAVRLPTAHDCGATSRLLFENVLVAFCETQFAGL